MGLGNGGVFKLVPQYFPASTGTVTGLVGAMGGMGGFFPPLLLGFFRDRMGTVWPGFLCLSAMALALWWLNRKIFIPRQEALELALPPELNRTADRLRAGSWATLWTGLLIASIVVGSRTLQNFDAALVTLPTSVWSITIACGCKSRRRKCSGGAAGKFFFVAVFSRVWADWCR
jgi:hypothetical protein